MSKAPKEVSVEEVEELRRHAEDATPGPWAISEYWDEVWGDLQGGRVKRVLSVKLPASASNLAYIEYANPERILRLLSRLDRLERLEQRSEEGLDEKRVRFACFLLSLACQRHHCSDCFLPHKEKWCPKGGNREERGSLESVSRAEWYTFLMREEGEEDEMRKVRKR